MKITKSSLLIVLLCAVTIMSIAVAAYFAVMTKDLQYQISSSIEPDIDPSSYTPVLNDQGIPLSVHPEPVQVAFATDVPEGSTALSQTLRIWLETNPEICEPLVSYATIGGPWLETATPEEILQDTGIRSALLDYFNVLPADEDRFFQGILANVDEDDEIGSFYDGSAMCPGGSGKSFLLLTDVHEVRVGYDGLEKQAFAEILEWQNDTSGHGTWDAHIIGEHRVMDGYRFIPDWNGQQVIITGYGDAGYAHWETEVFHYIPGTLYAETIEKCILEPKNGGGAGLDYEPLVTCEIEYVQ